MGEVGGRVKPRSRSSSATRLSTPGKVVPIEDEDEKSIRAAENHFNLEWGIELDDNTNSVINNLQGHERLVKCNLYNEILEVVIISLFLTIWLLCVFDLEIYVTSWFNKIN